MCLSLFRTNMEKLLVSNMGKLQTQLQGSARAAIRNKAKGLWQDGSSVPPVLENGRGAGDGGVSLRERDGAPGCVDLGRLALSTTVSSSGEIILELSFYI